MGTNDVKGSIKLDYYNLKDKVILVCGGASGIGEAITRGFAAHYANVVIADIDKQKGDRLMKELSSKGYTILSITADLFDENDVEKLIKQTIDAFGGLDVLVNNVRGDRSRDNSFINQNLDDFEYQLGDTLGSYYITVKYSLPELFNSGMGVIVNISSIAAFQIGNENLKYHITKAAINQFTKFIADRYGSKGIRANTVSPGFIIRNEHLHSFESSQNTEYRKKAEIVHPLRRIGKVSEVADAVLFLASDRASFITGQDLVVDGGLTIRDQWSVLHSTDKNDESY